MLYTQTPDRVVVGDPGAAFARYLVEKEVLETGDQKELFDAFGREVRYWLYGRALYKTVSAEPPLVTV